MSQLMRLTRCYLKHLNVGDKVGYRSCSSTNIKNSASQLKALEHGHVNKLDRPPVVHQQLVNALESRVKNLGCLSHEEHDCEHTLHSVENVELYSQDSQYEEPATENECRLYGLTQERAEIRTQGKKRTQKRQLIKDNEKLGLTDSDIGYTIDMNSIVDSLVGRQKTVAKRNHQEQSWDVSLESFKNQMKNLTAEQNAQEDDSKNSLFDYLVGSGELLKFETHGELSSADIQPGHDHTANKKVPSLAHELSSRKRMKGKNEKKHEQLLVDEAMEGHDLHEQESLVFGESVGELSGSSSSIFLGGFDEAIEPESHASADLQTQKMTLSKAARKNKKVKLSEQVERSALGRSHSFVEDLKSYIDACVHAGLINKAHSTMCYFNRYSKTTRSGKKQNITTANIELYNILLRGWAKKHNMDKVRRLFTLLKEDGLQANMHSFAALLECLARMKHFDEDAAKKCIFDMTSCGLDVKNIMNQCNFQKDEKQLVYKAIKTVQPDFVPNPPPSYKRYSPSLVQHLNEVEPSCENPYQGVVHSDTLKDRAEQQLFWEKQLFLTVDSIERLPPPTTKTIEMREKLKQVHDEWKMNLLASFRRKVDALNKREHAMNIYPYTKLFKPEEYVDLILQEIQLLATQSNSFSPGIGILWKRLGLRAHRKYLIQDKINNQHAEKVSQVYGEFCQSYNGPTQNHREAWNDIAKEHDEGPTLDLPEKHWPWHTVRALGRFLYDIILYDTKLDRNILKVSEEKHLIPAFYTVYRKNNKLLQMTEEVKPHPVLVTLYKEAGWKELNFEVHELPMLVPPVPWCSVTYGGNLLGSTQLVRANEMTRQQMLALKALPPNQMNAVLDSLNILSACPWKINKPVLDIIVDMFNNKGDKDLDIPPPVSECPPIPSITLDMTSTEKSKIHRERLRLKQKQSEMYSLWCNELYKLSIANMFRDEIFWFPHNMDFRGRVYPCPPHFNHLGSDVTRSILLFAKGKPLGEKGLDWLKIHLINLTGFKKRCSNAERLAYADEVMTDIMDSAENPMLNDWWKSSDEPWQTLAGCMELRNALQSPNPSEYVCHFPIHQDGSCNGLQHYAALGRDQSGAESVNLHPFQAPKDVYSDVAEMVEKLRTADAKGGNHTAQVLEGFIKRKVIKQTVMTTVYGVTRYGAKFQILKQLRDLADFPQDHAWAASSYLTEKTFQSLQQMFTATKEIQDWFTTCAQLISTVRGKPVEWVTPIGMPVIQPYHKTVMSSKGGMVATNKNNMFEKPNSMKQKNAMPPNFIHSLDSTHMMLTSLHCFNEGITFVSVHDCFWTHACDVDTMNRVIREQFVALHSEPILEDLSQYMLQCSGYDGVSGDGLQVSSQSSFLNSVLGMVPSRGEFNLKNVLNSTYFFS